MLVSIAHKYTFVNLAIETIFHSHQQSPPKTMACIVTMWQDFFWTDGGGVHFCSWTSISKQPQKKKKMGAHFTFHAGKKCRGVILTTKERQKRKKVIKEYWK